MEMYKNQKMFFILFFLVNFIIYHQKAILGYVQGNFYQFDCLLKIQPGPSIRILGQRTECGLKLIRIGNTVISYIIVSPQPTKNILVFRVGIQGPHLANRMLVRSNSSYDEEGEKTKTCNLQEEKWTPLLTTYTVPVPNIQSFYVRYRAGNRI